jgi:hypothetical protein
VGPPTLPAAIGLLRVAGSHREVGRQVGEATAEVLRRGVEFDERLPSGRGRDDQLALAVRYREATRRAVPWIVEEIDGAAEGAGVDPLALFAISTEEIWGASTPPEIRGGGPRRTQGRCSDLVAVPPLTRDGHVWVAHNNDLRPSTEPDVVAIEWRVPGEPVVLSLGIGPWISVGWNDAGLSLTGNELTPNDERVGVPRLLMVREQLTATTLEAATDLALRPDRASSYNTVYGFRDGRALDIEGSATDAEITRPDEHGALAHTNHYVCDRMLPYEGDPGYALLSGVRYARATELLAEARPGTVDGAWMRAALSDHATDPSICRHDPAGDGSKTVFWCVADVTLGEITFGRGNPCRSVAQTYRFEAT